MGDAPFLVSETPYCARCFDAPHCRTFSLGIDVVYAGLIVREKGSKMPADLGGDIYALLPDKVDIGRIERVVSGFMAAL
jgi:hypothetical protein